MKPRDHAQQPVRLSLCAACHVSHVLGEDEAPDTGCNDDGTCSNCDEGPVLIGMFNIAGEIEISSNTLEERHPTLDGKEPRP